MSKLPATIKLDFASDKYPAKEGYDDGYGFNMSFETYEVTPEQFLELCSQGRAHTQELSKHMPEYYGRSDVSTFKITENVQSMWIVVLDDDTGDEKVIQRWLDVPFFQRYGYALIESSSSTPKEQKVHVVFILDQPITEQSIMKQALKAFIAKYVFADNLPNIERTIYNGIGCNQYVVGNVLPFQVLFAQVITPYQKLIDDKREQVAIEREKLRLENLNRPKAEYSQSGVRRWLEKAYEGIVRDLANTTKGFNRNNALLASVLKAKSLMVADWVQPHISIFVNLEEDLIYACGANGYHEDYGGGSDFNARRQFRTLMSYDVTPRPEPFWRDTPMNPSMENRVHSPSKIEPSKATASSQEIEKALEDRYWQGYRDGFLDGYLSAMSQHGGTHFWQAIGVDEVFHPHFELGYDAQNERLVMPSYDHSGKLVNVLYWAISGGVSEVAYEHDSPLGCLYQPDTSLKHSHTTLIVTDPVQAVKATSQMLLRNPDVSEQMAIYYLSPDAFFPEVEALVNGIDTSRIVLVSNLKDHTIPEEKFDIVRPFMSVVRPIVDLDSMIQHNTDMLWLDRMVAQSDRKQLL